MSIVTDRGREPVDRNHDPVQRFGPTAPCPDEIGHRSISDIRLGGDALERQLAGDHPIAQLQGGCGEALHTSYIS